MTDPRDPGFLAVAFFLICHLLAHVLALAMPTVRESAKVGQAEEFSALELSLAAKPKTSKSKTKAPPPPAEDNSSDSDVVEVKEEKLKPVKTSSLITRDMGNDLYHLNLFSNDENARHNINCFTRRRSSPSCSKC